MAVIAPFRGLRYNLAKIPNMEAVVTPPYDVIDAGAQAAFMAKNPYNMIHLDLSKNVKADQLTEARYAGAKQLFEAWQAEGVLVRDEQPAIYIYHVEYGLPSGERRTRKGLLAQVRLAEFSEGIVKPHEKTFANVTGDRLRLLDTCHAQFSPIFSLYSDAEGAILARLDAGKPEALCSATDHDGCVHRLWRVTEPAALTAVQEMFREKALYIADGHHRYTTALQFRALMRERLGSVPPESPYNHTMMYICPMEEPGLAVLPTHRLVRAPGRLAVEDLLARFAEAFGVEEIDGGGREMLIAELFDRMSEAAAGQTRFGFYHAAADRSFLLTMKEGAMERLAGHHPEALRDLDVVALSDLIFDKFLTLDKSRCVQGDLLEYYSDADEALDVAVKEVQVASEYTPLLFLMNATLVSQVRRVADEGLVMPHKSTFFYPKLLTGLLLNKIVPDEEIR
ncbi:MAG: DUF1015 domain-containing protein [Thermodesulfobacteriota bacterium]